MREEHSSTASHESDMSAASSFGMKTSKESERNVFQKARHYLNPGACFRCTTYLFAERKLFIFFLVHFMCTMIIWTHFALTKFTEQEEKVPVGAPRYWWKRLAPPLEFGSMHAILFQMTLLPLTMSRYSISALSDSILNRFIPLNRAVRLHIHLGYTMVTIVFFATVFFFAFFGLLCSEGDQSVSFHGGATLATRLYLPAPVFEFFVLIFLSSLVTCCHPDLLLASLQFCAKFTDEIMITGYFILAFLLTIGGTSFFRHSIPYEW